MAPLIEDTMTNKEKLIASLKEAPGVLSREISYFLNDVDHEDYGQEYTIVEAFSDVMDYEQGNPDRLLKAAINQILIEIGYLVKPDPNAVLMGASKAQAYTKVKGEWYDVADSWEQFINS